MIHQKLREAFNHLWYISVQKNLFIASNYLKELNKGFLIP